VCWERTCKTIVSGKSGYAIIRCACVPRLLWSSAILSLAEWRPLYQKRGDWRKFVLGNSKWFNFFRSSPTSMLLTTSASMGGFVVVAQFWNVNSHPLQAPCAAVQYPGYSSIHFFIRLSLYFLLINLLIMFRNACVLDLLSSLWLVICESRLHVHRQKGSETKRNWSVRRDASGYCWRVQ
jgi:hypothetical protein